MSKKFSAGTQVLSPSRMNYMLEGADLAHNHFGGISKSTNNPFIKHNVIVQNKTGFAQTILTPVGITKSLKTDAADEFALERINEGILLEAGYFATDEDVVAVLVEAAEKDQIVRAIVSGAVTTQVNVTDVSHKYAKPVVGAAVLESTASGSIRIVAAPEATGLQYVDVILGGGGGAEPQHRIVKIEDTWGIVHSPIAAVPDQTLSPANMQVFDTLGQMKIIGHIYNDVDEVTQQPIPEYQYDYATCLTLDPYEILVPGQFYRVKRAVCEVLPPLQGEFDFTFYIEFKPDHSIASPLPPDPDDENQTPTDQVWTLQVLGHCTVIDDDDIAKLEAEHKPIPPLITVQFDNVLVDQIVDQDDQIVPNIKMHFDGVFGGSKPDKLTIQPNPNDYIETPANNPDDPPTKVPQIRSRYNVNEVDWFIVSPHPELTLGKDLIRFDPDNPNMWYGSWDYDGQMPAEDENKNDAASYWMWYYVVLYPPSKYTAKLLDNYYHWNTLTEDGELQEGEYVEQEGDLPPKWVPTDDPTTIIDERVMNCAFLVTDSSVSQWLLRASGEQVPRGYFLEKDTSYSAERQMTHDGYRLVITGQPCPSEIIEYCTMSLRGDPDDNQNTEGQPNQ